MGAMPCVSTNAWARYHIIVLEYVCLYACAKLFEYIAIVRLMRGFSESTVHNMGIGRGVPMYIKVRTAEVSKKGHILIHC